MYITISVFEADLSSAPLFGVTIRKIVFRQDQTLISEGKFS